MPQQINPSVRVIKNYPVDERSMFWDGTAGDWRPFEDIAEANATILSDVRYVGLLVRLNMGWYVYRDGILDSDLVPFEFKEIVIKVDGLDQSPVAGTYDYTNPLLIKATVTHIIVNKHLETVVDGDFTFDPATGTITRVNPWDSGDTCIIKRG